MGTRAAKNTTGVSGRIRSFVFYEEENSGLGQPNGIMQETRKKQGSNLQNRRLIKQTDEGRKREEGGEGRRLSGYYITGVCMWTGRREVRGDVIAW